jgi:hypothetical protein
LGIAAFPVLQLPTVTPLLLIFETSHCNPAAGVIATSAAIAVVLQADATKATANMCLALQALFMMGSSLWVRGLFLID